MVDRFARGAAVLGVLLLASMLIRVVGAQHSIPRDASAAPLAARQVATSPALEAGRSNLASNR